MTRAHATLLLAALLAGCAVGTVVRPDGTQVDCVAFGHASCESCVCLPEDGKKRCRRECATIKGGFLSAGLAGVLEGAVAAVSIYFAGS